MENSSPYLTNMYAPVDQEITAQDLEVEGEIPPQLEGFFIRNSPNPRFPPLGRHHWFDGDGMLHVISLCQGKASYQNKYIKTKPLQYEEEKGKALWGGLLDPLSRDLPYGPIKNTSNTDVVFHGGKLLTLWWLGDKPYEISLPECDTLGQYDFQGQLKGGMSSHPKVDPLTGELMFIDFNVFKPPFLHYGVISAEGKVTRTVPIDLPGPRILHDMAITENYSIILDLPLMWDPQALKQGKRKTFFDQKLPTRFGIIPRHGESQDIRWFEANPCYIYHTINAYEEGNSIVLVACRVENPIPSAPRFPHCAPQLYEIELAPCLFRWRFDLKTGQVYEEQLDDLFTEFPRMNNQFLGRPSRFSYHPRIAPASTLLFDGIVKYDLQNLHLPKRYEYGPRQFGGEVVFAPDPFFQSTPDHEDRGWIMTFVHDSQDDSSYFLILDAQDFQQGPVAKIKIPQKVPIGFHAWWVPRREAIPVKDGLYH